MGYKNGKDVLPAKLLKELQEYIQGDLIYIPKKEKRRAGWGELNGTRQVIERRNWEIYRRYRDGCGIDTLVDLYHLSEDSIRRIISKARQRMQG